VDRGGGRLRDVRRAASPITQTFGLGIFDPVGEEEFARLERFFRERGAPVCHEVCPMIAPPVLELLNTRGYRPIEFSSVLIRPAAAQLGAPTGSITVREIDVVDADLWSRVAAKGWSSESPELAAVVEGFGRIVASARGAHCFLAFLDGEAIAAAALVLNDDVALLAGASTVPDHRKQGAQLALLDARLRFAAAHGAQLAMMVALPGSGSHRNAERNGFRVTYTRTKWQLTQSLDH